MIKEYCLYKSYIKQQMRSFSKFSTYSYLFFISLFSIIFSSITYIGFRIDAGKGVDTSIKGIIFLSIFILFGSHIIHYIRSNKVDKSQLSLLPVSNIRLYFILLTSEIISLKNLPPVAMGILVCSYFSRQFWNWGIAFLYFLFFLICAIIWIQNFFTSLDLFKINFRSILRITPFLVLLLIWTGIWTRVFDSIEKNYVPLLPFNFIENLLISNKFSGNYFLFETGILLLILCVGLLYGYIRTIKFLKPE